MPHTDCGVFCHGMGMQKSHCISSQAHKLSLCEMAKMLAALGTIAARTWREKLINLTQILIAAGHEDG